MKQLELFDGDRSEPYVTLIDFTGIGREDENWHAANVLIYTKATRLNMTPDLLDQVRSMSESEKLAELEYMATTIRSSWEFVSATFLISGVSRAAAQQITRTRQASYAMQSQRVTDVSDAEVTNPYKPGTAAHKAFNAAARNALTSYSDMIKSGCAAQDARGILPMNIQSNLVARYNLRALVDLITARKSLRTQGEYRSIVLQMEAAIKRVWPWAEPFFRDKNEAAIAELQGVVDELGLETGKGAGWRVAKAIDLIRGA